MEITEVRLKLLPRGSGGEKLLAFCTITLDRSFVIRDIKVIEGTQGPFIAMPSRRVSDRCRECRQKNHLKARYCNGCGATLGDDRVVRDNRGRARLYVDIAHPINADTRREMHERVMEALQAEEAKASRGDYEFATHDDMDTEESRDYGEIFSDVEARITRSSGEDATMESSESATGDTPPGDLESGESGAGM